MGQGLGKQALDIPDSSCWGQREGLAIAPLWDVVGDSSPSFQTSIIR